MNCFRKAGFLPQDSDSIEEDDEARLVLEVKQQLHCLQQSDSDLQKVTPEDYIYGVEEVEASEELRNGDIIAQVQARIDIMGLI